ncbi:hypothetical protein M409DRAFT_67895 [Zasmidium cellare ATCC 36951]|uniref:Metallo-beta-lactamase domain-containing protein n=1 Tax=Zasmidium cellare ATCC 36951 TaxID=1080233 RepID=A0A6A6CDS9_ZASCE|nr:uncharacterized protein M409DRAFT_67895 [Zasmidium cellare ATCC 36951]KAF2164380.1 hypothetical protein M409DRAFT_67895 [Zasmidium cellare ATCC 36951]
MIEQQSLILPKGDITVDVAIIDTTTRIGGVPGSHYMAPATKYPSLSKSIAPKPSHSFLITHPPSNTRVLFDLGLRIDWQIATSRPILRSIQNGSMRVRVEKDVASILYEGGVDPASIDAVVFSHHHFDHTGDPTRFSQTMKVVVGPGYREAYLPGWPAAKQKWETTSDLYRGRDVVEISYANSLTSGRGLRIGGFETYDYFGDGAFYLLHTPGHTVGHLSALARTTLPAHDSDTATFIFLGGDVAHECALLRPSAAHPLPDQISSRDGPRVHALHREYTVNDGGETAKKSPFCTATGPHSDVAAAQQSIDALQAFDGASNVFVALAHDPDLLDVVELFPGVANQWRKRGWKERCHWRFLKALFPELGFGWVGERENKM